MKSLFIAAICLVLGTSVFANTPDLGKSRPVVTKVEVKLGLEKLKASTTVNQSSNKESGLFRIQRSCDFTDACGHIVRVWVSAPDGYTNGAHMYNTAYNYYFYITAGGSGCL
ncbi:hypothetical protein [Chryseobacterium sp. ISL-6]|uniref:hypothetical protein n=1 Tax=Chryseobacterium sp. ISL-6 TaxID=2819143 RepID=UPI001BE76395|nr:hypothetical protein [Chryseobacterium sp. ISL-6]MBT2621924.1 hypothetical protein [Chryseobacterium sp. ISL-6]